MANPRGQYYDGGKWDDLSTRAIAAFKAGQYTDCTFIVGRSPNIETIAAHKCILAFSSEVFAAMLFGPLAADSVPLPEDDPRIFKVLLKMLYVPDRKQYQFLVDVHDVCLLWETAHKYMIRQICDDMVDYLKSTVNFRNVPEIIDYAKMLGNADLEERCWTIIDVGVQHHVDYLFENLSMDVLLEMMDRDSLLIRSEMALLRGIELRCRLECKARLMEETHENLRKVGDAMVKKIRFLTLGSSFPARSNLLTVQEMECLRANALDTMKINGTMQMPEGFSYFLQKRQHPVLDAATNYCSYCRRSPPGSPFPGFDFDNNYYNY